MNIKLRQWQHQALTKAIKWLIEDRQDRHFLINAAPGAGKTMASCVIAQRLFELNEIDRVVIIAPRAEIVSQWSDDFKFVTGRHMAKVTAADGEVNSLGLDVCATWSAVQGLLPELQAVCSSARTLVICDEHHHAAVEAAWGNGADGAFERASYVLILTGTPIRSDGSHSIWLAHDSSGAIAHPQEGTYSLTYGEAVDLGYCRPVTFHRHEGRFNVDLEGQVIEVSGSAPTRIPTNLKRISGLQKALDFYTLARTPQYEKDKTTPLKDGYQATMIHSGSEKLSELRERMPNAGGLVIAPNIEMAEYMVKLLEMIEGEKPILVHSQLANPNAKIRAFRETNKRWLVSVAMVSEGVDIKRLRVLLYLPNAMTELSFRQAIGRVVRSSGMDDDTRAYVVMPAFTTFEKFARRVEDEMPPAARQDREYTKSKRCGACNSENSISAETCSHCDTPFPPQKERLKSCQTCGSLNPVSLTECMSCGQTFSAKFTLSLEEALRTGAIVRGMDIEEDEVLDAEKAAPHVRRRILETGDHRLIKIIQTLPDESWSRLRNILDGAQ